MSAASEASTRLRLKRADVVAREDALAALLGGRRQRLLVGGGRGGRRQRLLGGGRGAEGDGEGEGEGVRRGLGRRPDLHSP